MMWVVQATVRFNCLLADNRQLREELDHLLSERGLFNSLYARLTEQLAQDRKLAAELTDQATQAYDQRYALTALRVMDLLIILLSI